MAKSRERKGQRMILEFLMNIVVNCLCGVMKGLTIVSLPTDAIKALTTVIVYGNHLVGTDLLLTLFGCVMGWITIRCTVGLVVFVWKLLPLT